MQLNQLLGLPLTTALELTTPLAEAVGRPVPWEDKPEEAVSRAVERSIAVLKAEEDETVARLAFQLAARYFTPNVYVYRQTEAEWRRAESVLAKERVNAELEVRKTLLEIGAARARIEQQKKAVDLSDESLRLANLRYQAGVGTSTEVLGAQVSLAGARLAYAKAVFDLRAAAARYDNLVGR